MKIKSKNRLKSSNQIRGDPGRPQCRIYNAATKSFVVVFVVVLLIVCDNSISKKSLKSLKKVSITNFASCAMESQSLDFGFG